MTPEQVERIRAAIVDAIMARRTGASGVPVFVDPVIVGAIVDAAFKKEGA